jgi:hypothetical protein
MNAFIGNPSNALVAIAVSDISHKACLFISNIKPVWERL